MLKKTIIMLATLILLLPVTSTMAKGQNSPFLITGKLPHLTKLLMKQWDNPALNLSEPQKAKLMVIRTETISGVRELGPQVAALQKQVVEGINHGKKPGELHVTVTQLAALKAEATMLHLNCIYKTRAILNAEQLHILTKK